jgi:hypothetical protein
MACKLLQDSSISELQFDISVFLRALLLAKGLAGLRCIRPGSDERTLHMQVSLGRSYRASTKELLDSDHTLQIRCAFVYTLLSSCYTGSNAGYASNFIPGKCPGTALASTFVQTQLIQEKVTGRFIV